VAIKDEADAPNLPNSTELAVDRTNLAHERTQLAWVRTAVSLISFGFTIYKFFQYMQEQGGNQPVKRLLGPREFALLMIGIGLVSLLLATLQQWRFRKKMRERYQIIAPSLATALAAVMAVLGLLAFIAVILRQ